nr:hypothetical protein [Tanacetum cinerariifolium]
MDKYLVFFFATVLVLFVLVISDIEAAAPPAKTCEKMSKTYSGACENKKCDQKCKGWEKSQHGACHVREGKNGCFCYYDCTNTSPPGKDKSKPPSKGGGGAPGSGGGAGAGAGGGAGGGGG